MSLAAASTGPAPRGSQCAEAAEAHAASSAALCWSDMERLREVGRLWEGRVVIFHSNTLENRQSRLPFPALI